MCFSRRMNVKTVTSLLLMLVMLGVFIQSSEAVRCYRCEYCDEPIDEYCTNDVCITDVWPSGVCAIYSVKVSFMILVKKFRYTKHKVVYQYCSVLSSSSSSSSSSSFSHRVVWLGSVVVTASDLQSTGCGFESRPGRYRQIIEEMQSIVHNTGHKRTAGSRPIETEKSTAEL